MTTLPAAAAHYARAMAQLPSFPAELWYIHAQQRSSDSHKREDPVLPVVVTSKVTGQVLPRSEDVWLALLPFDDLAKKKLPETHNLQSKFVLSFTQTISSAASATPAGHFPLLRWHQGSRQR